MRDASPLRYPGGKWRLTPFVSHLISQNQLDGCHYVEPYAGGGSLALSLLLNGVVTNIHLNDLDPAIHAFWHSVLNHNGEFIKLTKSARVTIAEWEKQKEIYYSASPTDKLTLGFATFFLNRTNHSGILNGGVIGGRSQSGEWRINARFHKADLVRRIERIGKYKNQIDVYCEDALEFLRNARWPRNAMKYLDPPYFGAGKRLYLNSYKLNDHQAVGRYITRLQTAWLVSYDDVPQIRKFYSDVRSRKLQLLHTARASRVGKEVLFFSEALRIPRNMPSRAIAISV